MTRPLQRCDRAQEHIATPRLESIAPLPVDSSASFIKSLSSKLKFEEDTAAAQKSVVLLIEMEQEITSIPQTVPQTRSEYHGLALEIFNLIGVSIRKRICLPLH